MGLSLPWHEPVLAKAVRTVYLRNAVIFQYNSVGSRTASHPTIIQLLRAVCLVSLWGPHFGQCARYGWPMRMRSVRAFWPSIGGAIPLLPACAFPISWMGWRRSTYQLVLAAVSRACDLDHEGELGGEGGEGGKGREGERGREREREGEREERGAKYRAWGHEYVTTSLLEKRRYLGNN